MGVMFLPTLKVTAKVSGVFHYVTASVGGVKLGIFPGHPALDRRQMGLDPETRLVPTSDSCSSRGADRLAADPGFRRLFAAADAAYAGLIERVFNIAPEELFSHLLLTAIFFWLTAGYYRGFLLGGDLPVPAVPVEDMASEKAADNKSNLSIFEQVRAEEGAKPETLPDNATILEHINKSDPPNAESGEAKTETPPPAAEKKVWQWQNIDNSLVPQAFTLGVIETSVVLGLMNLLFLSFVIMQVPYLFGGMDLVQNTPDFKLAEYARRGFGELVAVTVLVLPILLASHWLLRKENPLNEKIYRVLAGVQIALLFVIMASAMQRLFLLTGNLGYGLTTVRFYPMVVMIWFAIVFIWFGLTVLRGARQYFAWGALWSALFVLIGVHVINPDEFIVRTNIRLMKNGREFDAVYNSDLSADAIPTLLESMGSMNADDQCEVKHGLIKRYNEAITKGC